jgi:hypothetical protein
LKELVIVDWRRAICKLRYWTNSTSSPTSAEQIPGRQDLRSDPNDPRSRENFANVPRKLIEATHMSASSRLCEIVRDDFPTLQ